MTPIRRAIILGVGLLLGTAQLAPVQAAPAHLATPPASFLKYRVDSVAELLAQVKSDRTVRMRYAHLFGISENKVVDYMSKNLVESYVPATGKYSVWCVSRSGRMFTVKQHFHSGIRVFALRNGTPVMKWACGNPLTKLLPQAPVAPTMESKVVLHPVVQVAEAIELTPTEPQEKVAAYTDTTATELPQSTAHVTLVPFEEVKGSTEQLIFSGSSTRIPFLPFIPLIGLIPRSGTTPFVGTFSRGGSGSSAGGGNRSGGSGPVGGGGLVPETNPAITVMLGLLPLGGLIIAARRRRTVSDTRE